MTGTDVADRAISRLAVSNACLGYSVGYAGYSFQQHLGPARYFVYAVPGILVGSLLFQRNSRINEPATGYLIMYLSMGFVAYLMGVKDTQFFLNDFVIM